MRTGWPGKVKPNSAFKRDKSLAVLSTANPMNTLAYIQTVEIATTPLELWQALVEPDIVTKYHLAPLKEIELRENGNILYGTPEADLIFGRVLKAEPGQLLEHSFRFALPSHDGTLSDEETIVSYAITPLPQGVSLTLSHCGFLEENQTYANISGGWPFILEGLKSLLEHRPS